MHLFVSLILGSVVIAAIEGSAQVPSYFKKCAKDDPELNKCLLKSALAGFSKFSKGDPSIHMVSLRPLKVPEMFINVDGNLKINLTDSEISGISDSQIKDLIWDSENKIIKIKFFIPQVNLLGTYDIAGRILILPINGQGPINVTYVNTDYKCTLHYEEEERHGKQYVHFVKNSLTYVLERAYFKLDNLFGGDPTLGGEMNKFLDENWKEVNEEIGVRVGDALGEVIGVALQAVFYRIPIDSLF